MTEFFTTKEFYSALTLSGIDVEAKFWHTPDGGIGIKTQVIWSNDEEYDPTIVCIETGKKYNGLDGHDITTFPRAFLSMEVLKWLPKYIQINRPYHGLHLSDLIILNNEAKPHEVLYGYGKWQIDGTIMWDKDPMPVEQLVLFGLSDGWLTKEMILLAIKESKL